MLPWHRTTVMLTGAATFWNS